MYGVAPSYATSSKDRTSEFHAALGKFTTTPRPASTTQRPTSAHADFTRRAQSVAQALGVTTAKLDRLSQLARRKTLFDDRPVEISELTYIIKHDIAGLNRQLAELQQMSGSSRGGRANRTDEHRSNMLTMLQSSLANTTTSFQDILEVRTQNMKASKDRSEQFFSGPPTLDMQRSRSPLYTLARGQTGSTLPAVRDTPVPTSALHNRGATAATMSDEKSMNMAPNDHGFLALDMMESGGIQQQQLLLNEFEDQQSGYLQQRSNAIESIESTISELGQIFGQLAQMVAQQGETVQRIDDDVLHVSDNVEGARRELLKYYASIANNRWLMLKIFGVLIVFFLRTLTVFASLTQCSFSFLRAEAHIHLPVVPRYLSCRSVDF